MLIIGVTGHPLSGKDAVMDHLVTKGFQYFSGGDILREELQRQGRTPDRQHIHEFVTKMRSEHGNAYVAEKIAQRIQGDAVTGGFRNTEEVKVFRNRFGKNFILLAIEAPVEIRYERAKIRQRMGDMVSFEQFVKEEEQERDSSSGAYEVDKVIEGADYHIENLHTLAELVKKIDDLLNKVR